MIDPDGFQITKVQAALFTRPLAFSGNRLLGRLLGEWAELLDGDPLILPVPPEAPAEIPRILLRSSEGGFTLQAAQARIDVVANQVRWNKRIVVEDCIRQCLEVGRTAVEATDATVNRIAFIENRAAIIAEPGIALSRHFCQERWWQERPLNRPENFELHAHKTYAFCGRHVNSWVRCKTGEIRTSDPGVEPAVRERGVIVEQDFNTVVLPDPDAEIAWSDVEDFFKNAPAEADAVLSYYFPRT